MRRPRRHPAVSGNRIVRAVTAGSAVVLAFAGLVSVGSPAGAAGPTSAYVRTTDTGQLEAVFAQGVLWAQVTVRAADQSVLFQTDDLDLSYDSDLGSYAARTDDPVRLPSGRPLGSYVTDVDYRYPSGTVQHWSGAANPTLSSFVYAEHARVTGTTAPGTTDFDHRTVTVTGTSEIDDPRDGSSAAPPTGTPVELDGTATDAQGQSKPVKAFGSTDSDGHFSVDVTPNGALVAATARLLIDEPTTVDASGTVPYVGTVRSEARLYATPTVVRVHAGASVTIAGVAQVLTVDGWRPLAGELVQSRLDSQVVVASGRTDSSGRFSYPLSRSSYSTVSTQVATTSYLTAVNSAGTTVNVPTKGSLTGVRLALDAYGTVTGSALLHGNCGSQVVTLQYSPNGHTGWSTLAPITTPYGSPCGFSLHGDGYVNGYYRLAHAESDQMLAVTSRVSHLYRTLTRISGLRLTPARPAKNGTLTATGHLQQLVGKSWRGLARGAVVLIWRPSGETGFYKIKSGRTTATGGFSMRGKVYGSGGWIALYQPDAHHFYTETAVRNVKVR